jgi:hypothetical protein
MPRPPANVTIVTSRGHNLIRHGQLRISFRNLPLSRNFSVFYAQRMIGRQPSALDLTVPLLFFHSLSEGPLRMFPLSA